MQCEVRIDRRGTEAVGALRRLPACLEGFAVIMQLDRSSADSAAERV
jgi:hypothetical protein